MSLHCSRGIGCLRRKCPTRDQNTSDPKTNKRQSSRSHFMCYRALLPSKSQKALGLIHPVGFLGHWASLIPQYLRNRTRNAGDTVAAMMGRWLLKAGWSAPWVWRVHPKKRRYRQQIQPTKLQAARSATLEISICCGNYSVRWESEAGDVALGRSRPVVDRRTPPPLLWLPTELEEPQNHN